ncbi:MmoB/DmpM family protein [Labrys monachus]|uniref:Toluene monooxygenase system protein D n=1 Tax=Labrys monachus TaxID=217067 RepID=A0ABU0F6Y1_9HYPH|nr:MmoB/DmpM family protein [Labrys monachus]MDQ0390370.1 toluene monooxygenase system protein D [Labrys monachus]
MATMKSRNLVGPVIQAGEMADAIVEAAQDDNPGKEVLVSSRASYIRIELEGECILRRETIQSKLGRPFQMNEIELNMPSFAGQVETNDDSIRFYYAQVL